MMKALIEESTRERKLPRPIGVGATGTTKTGAVGIARLVVVLGSSCMSIVVKMICKVIKGIY